MEQFKKEDLRENMVIETREGEFYLYLPNDFAYEVFISPPRSIPLSHYTEDLKTAQKSDTIMRVYSLSEIGATFSETLNIHFIAQYGTLLWERKGARTPRLYSPIPIAYWSFFAYAYCCGFRLLCYGSCGSYWYLTDENGSSWKPVKEPLLFLNKERTYKISSIIGPKVAKNIRESLRNPMNF